MQLITMWFSLCKVLELFVFFLKFLLCLRGTYNEGTEKNSREKGIRRKNEQERIAAMKNKTHTEIYGWTDYNNVAVIFWLNEKHCNIDLCNFFRRFFATIPLFLCKTNFPLEKISGNSETSQFLSKLLSFRSEFSWILYCKDFHLSK